MKDIGKEILYELDEAFSGIGHDDADLSCWTFAERAKASVTKLAASYTRLLEELINQWDLNHDERCTNIFPHDGVCHYPRPAIIEEAENL